MSGVAGLGPGELFEQRYEIQQLPGESYLLLSAS